MDQLKLIINENAVTNQSSAVITKQLVAVQLSFQCFNDLSGSERQFNAKASTALKAIQRHVFFQCPSGPAMVLVKPVESCQCFYSARLVDKICRQLVDCRSCQKTVKWGIETNDNHWFVQWEWCQSSAFERHATVLNEEWTNSSPVHLWTMRLGSPQCSKSPWQCSVL